MMTMETKMPRAVMIAAMPIAMGLSLAQPAHADSAFQDTTAIDAAVATFTGRPIGVEGGARTAVDTRLKLAPCPMVALSWYGTTHSAVQVTCSNPNWRMFVPVMTPPPAPLAPVIAAAPAPRPEMVIKRGDPITVEVNAPGFSIARDGVAMSDAAAGGRLLVNVDGTKKPIQAIAVENGRATLPGWTE